MYLYRAFVKDALRLEDKPKAFLRVLSFTIRRDLLTSANSTFTVLEVPTNIDNSDIFCLYNPYGKVIYEGVISKVKDNEIQCSQIQSFYKGAWLYQTSASATLEEEVAAVLDNYANGTVDGVNDPLMVQKYGSVRVTFAGSTTANLPTEQANYTIDFEDFIYSLYQKYGIVFDFDFSANDVPELTISTPNYTAYKLANNNNSISAISPVTEIAQTNKLIIYATDGTYRATYYATSEGITTDADDPLRFKTINTKIVFSDDTLDTIVAANLTADMYNHKLTFSMLLNSNLYNWDEWQLGQPLEIYYNSQYFKSVYTGYELIKEQDQELYEVNIICGKVRTSLTKKLTLRSDL